MTQTTEQIETKKTIALVHAAMADLPSVVDIRNVKPNANNPRLDLDIEGMLKTFETLGYYDANFPLVLMSDKPPTMKGNVLQGNFVGLQGNRRISAIHALIAKVGENPKQKIGKTFVDELLANIAPGFMVPAFCRTGLDKIGQLRALNDHARKDKPLTFFERMRNATALLAHYTPSKAAYILGNGKADIQHAKRYMVQPQEVRDLVEAGTFGPSSVKALYDAGNTDAGKINGAFEVGEAFDAQLTTEKIKATGGETNVMTEGERKTHLTILAVECPALLPLFAPFGKGGKPGIPAAIAAAQELAKKLGIKPTKKQEAEETK